LKRKVIAILGTLDTKEAEAYYLKNRIEFDGLGVLIVDTSSNLSAPTLLQPDIKQDEVASAAGKTIQEVAKMERGAAAETMAKGLAKIIKDLSAAGKIHGIIGYGGSFGVSVIAQALEALPIGFPKLILTTIAKDAGKFLGVKDVTVMPSVTDLAGGKTVNRIEAKILANAAAAMVGMVKVREIGIVEKPTILMTQMGVTTPCILKAKSLLEERGYEVTTFHAIGTGGRTVEALIDAGFASGILDITLAEISNELVGGVCIAGPDRLTAAGRMGLPQVISLGALDMVNFWGPETKNVPAKFKDRLFYFHNPMVTLMRVTKEESVELAKIIASKINNAKGPSVIVIPMKGWSSYDKEGGVGTVDYQGKPTGKPWYDPATIEAFTRTLAGSLDLSRPNIDLVKVDKHINDPDFAELLVRILDDMIGGRWQKSKAL